MMFAQLFKVCDQANFYNKLPAWGEKSLKTHSASIRSLQKARYTSAIYQNKVTPLPKTFPIFLRQSRIAQKVCNYSDSRAVWVNKISAALVYIFYEAYYIWLLNFYPLTIILDNADNAALIRSEASDSSEMDGFCLSRSS